MPPFYSKLAKNTVCSVYRATGYFSKPYFSRDYEKRKKKEKKYGNK